MADSDRPASRRDFLTGRAVRAEVEWVGEKIAEAALGPAGPSAGPTIRMGTRAMATEFAVILNPGPAERFLPVSNALEELQRLEDEMTVYRPDGELARLNASASAEPAAASSRLFDVLQRAQQIADRTGGAYDPTSGPLIELWRQCRAAQTIPTAEQLATVLERVGIERVELDPAALTVRFFRNGLELNLGGIGKGFALDVLGQRLLAEGVSDWLMHGGKSSILASGVNAGLDGWPVGIRHPLFPNRRLATVLLRNQGMSTSGAGVQFFRHEGKRYGHILDPRTGLPAEGVLSVTVLAPTAAEADALSTAFFVMGLEKTREYCDNDPLVTVLMAPPPSSGKRLQVYAFNLPEQTLFLRSDDELIDDHT